MLYVLRTVRIGFGFAGKKNNDALNSILNAGCTLTSTSHTLPTHPRKKSWIHSLRIVKAVFMTHPASPVT